MSDKTNNLKEILEDIVQALWNMSAIGKEEGEHLMKLISNLKEENKPESSIGSLASD